MAKHYGSFAKGFADSMMAMMKLQMTRELYEAREQYYRNKGLGGANSQNAAELQRQIGQGRNDPSYGSGGGPTSQNMQANQKEAYNAAVAEGLSPDSAKAFVANTTGEGLGVPGDVHKDGPHDAHGIVQWDDQRSAAIKAQFGKAPQDMTVAEQTKAAIWEMKTNPRFAASWQALQGNGSPESKIDTLVRNYEVPADPDKAVAQRTAALRSLPGSLGTTATASAGKPVKTAEAQTPYQVAGDAGGVSEEGAKKAEADLAAHRAPADEPLDESWRSQPYGGHSMNYGPPKDTAAPAIPSSPMGPNPPPPGQMGPTAPTAAQKTYGPPEPSVGEKPQYGPALPPGGLPKEADKPAPDAQPVSSPARPGQSNSQSNSDPRFTQISAPNQDPNARNERQMTALDLSHLWGSNPPLSQRAPTPPPPDPTPTRRPDDDNWQVGTPNMDDAALGMQMGAAKGGTVKGYAAGGAIPASPTMGYAAAGPITAQNWGTPTPQMTQSLNNMGSGISQTAYRNRQAQAFAGDASLKSAYQTVMDSLNTGVYGSTNPNLINMNYQQVGDKYNALTPDQQTWFNNTNQTLTGAQGLAQSNPALARQMLSGVGAFPTTPVAATPAPAAPVAATPAPVVTPPTVENITAPQVDTTVTDPTTTTVTGAPGLSNALQAKSYDPNVDQQTGAGFSNTNNAGGTDYSVGSDDLLKQNDKGQISGSTILSAKGGPITPRVRFDDGGGINPSAGGMPPGLGTPAIPPIYFNPATYSAAGAPVGKGISAPSAPTASAGAIPNMPLAKGGPVGYADGGEVDPMDQLASMDAQDDRAEAANAPPPTPQSDKDPGWYINPQDQASAAPTSGATTATDHLPPPDPTAPQIKDDAGNPSKGLIGAISDGLHWLGDHLGVGSAQAGAIAPNADTHTARQQFASNDPSGPTYFTHQNAAELNDIADPNHTLQGAYRNIAGLEQGYKWALSRGDDATASRLAASMLHYSVIASQNLSDQAAKALYKGDMQGAVDKMNQASDAVPDGRLVHATLNKDGTVTIQGKNLNGQVEWQQHGAAQTILERATSLGKSGKLQWDSLESQAAKYDSTFAEMAKNRNANKIAQGKDDQADRDAEAENVVLKGMNAPRVPNSPAITPAASPAIPPTPAGGAPKVQTAATAGAPPTPDSSGTAQQNAPPPDADSNAGVGGYSASNLGSPAGAIPPTPTPPTGTAAADVPSPAAQDVDSGPAPPTRPDEVDGYSRLRPQQQNEVWKTYNAQYKEYAAQRAASAAEARTNAQAERTRQSQEAISKRQADAMAHSDTAREQTQQHSDAAALQRQEADAKAKATAVQTGEEHAARAPRPDGDVRSVFALTPQDASNPNTKTPAQYYKDQFGLDSEGKMNPQLGEDGYNQAYKDRNSRLTMDNALVNGFRYSHDLAPQEVADGLRGFVMGAYHADAVKVPHDGYGDRYEVTFTRPSDGTTTVVTLPKADWANVMKMQQKGAQPPATPTPTPRRTSALPPAPASEGNYAAGP